MSNDDILRVLAAASFVVYVGLTWRRIEELRIHRDWRAGRAALAALALLMATGLLTYSAVTHELASSAPVFVLGLVRGAILASGIILLTEPAA